MKKIYSFLFQKHDIGFMRFCYAMLFPCALCGVDLVQENRLNPLAKKYADIPFRTFYVHPKNGCFLEALALRGEQLEKWNNRNA